MSSQEPLAPGSSSSDGGPEPRPCIKATFKEVLQLALPNMATMFMALLTELINTLFLGHVGNDKVLAAVGLANMMQNCFGLSVGFGVISALDTLVSQAHGASRQDLACHYLQRGRILVTLQLVWMVPLLFFTENLLVLIRQDAEVARYAGDYNRASIYGLFAVFQFQSSVKFLQNRGHAAAPAIIGGFTSCLHVAWCSLFISHLQWGNHGAGCANACTWWCQFLLSTVHLAWHARKENLPLAAVLGLQRPAFREWGPFLKLALPGTLQLCCEWWFWEVCAIVVGYLGSVVLAAHVATMNWVGLSFMPVIGIGMSAATLVGNALGAGQPLKGKLAVRLCFLLNLAVWGCLAVAMAVGRNFIAKAYSSEEEVQKLMEKLLLIFAVVGFCDTSQNVLGAALRGAGCQNLAAVTYLVSFWGLMLPMACVGAFVLKFGIYGIWVSMGIGTSIAVMVFATALLRLDFKRLAQESAARMEREAATERSSAVTPVEPKP